MSHRLPKRWPALATLLAFVALCGAGCGGGKVDSSEFTLTVASRDTAEETVLGEIYAQALEAAGYRVKRDLRLPPGPPPLERKGKSISGYPEHLNIALKDALRVRGRAPGDPRKAYELAEETFEEDGMVAFPPAPFSRSLAVVMLRKKAEERGLTTLSDLKRQAGDIAIQTGELCIAWANCLGGLRRFYGMSFGSFTTAPPQLRFKALETGQAGAAFILNTEGRFAEEKGKFTILEDDRHLLPSGSELWVTTQDAVDEAGPDYEKAIVAAQKGLTLQVVQKLDAEVKLQKRPAREVAAEYLRSLGGLHSP